MSRSRDLTIIQSAAFLRSFGIGLLGVLLGIHLYRQGLSSTWIGIVIAAGLAGAAAATVVISFRSDRLGRRRTLCVLAILATLGAVPLVLHFHPAALAVVAFFGMLNGMGTDRTAAFAIEQAIIPGLVSDGRRTWALSWYNVVLDSGGALGALAAGLPTLAPRWFGIELQAAYADLFLLFAGLNATSGLLYLLLSPAVEVGRSTDLTAGAQPVTPETRRIVTRLAALFSLDSFGGGFLTDALVSYWFFRRFGVPEHQLGALFFCVHVLNAASHLGAAWLARRIGLVNTMVFTHLPSSLFLIAVPFAPSFPLAVALFLLRESLVEMDVPTRQSYVAALVRPEERTFASGITNLARNVFWAVSSSLAGALMQNVAFSAPLVLGGSLKITYDLLLYRGFRRLKPPEEQSAPRVPPGRLATSGDAHPYS